MKKAVLKVGIITAIIVALTIFGLFFSVPYHEPVIDERQGGVVSKNTSFDLANVPETAVPQGSSSYTVGQPADRGADYLTVADALADESVKGDVVLRLVATVTETAAIGIPDRIDSLTIDSVDTTKYRLRMTAYGESWGKNGGWTTQNATAVFCNGKNFTLGKYVELVATTFNNSVAIFGGGYQQDVYGDPVITFDGNYYDNRHNCLVYAGGFNADLTGNVSIVVNGDLTAGEVYCGGLAEVRNAAAETPVSDGTAQSTASAAVNGNVRLRVGGSGVVGYIYGGGEAKILSSSLEDAESAASAWAVTATLNGNASIELAAGATGDTVYCGGSAYADRGGSVAESIVDGNVTMNAESANMKQFRGGGDSSAYYEKNTVAKALNTGTVDAAINKTNFTGSSNTNNIVAGGYAFMSQVKGNGIRSITESRGKITLNITDSQIYGEVIGGGSANNSSVSAAGMTDTYCKSIVGDVEVRLTNVTNANNFYNKIQGAGKAFGNYTCFEKNGDLLFEIDGYRLAKAATDSNNKLQIAAGGSVSSTGSVYESAVIGNLTMQLKNIGTDVEQGSIDLLTAGPDCNAESRFKMTGDIRLTLNNCALPIGTFAAIYMDSNKETDDTAVIEGAVTTRLAGAALNNNYGAAYLYSAGASVVAEGIETEFVNCTFSQRAYDGYLSKSGSSVRVITQKNRFENCAFSGTYFGVTAAVSGCEYTVDSYLQNFVSCTLPETHIVSATASDTAVTLIRSESRYIDCASIGNYFGFCITGENARFNAENAILLFDNSALTSAMRAASASGKGSKISVKERIVADYRNTSCAASLNGITLSGENSVGEVGAAETNFYGATLKGQVSGALVSGLNASLTIGNIVSTFDGGVTEDYIFGGVYLNQTKATANVTGIEMTLKNDVTLQNNFNWTGNYVADGATLNNETVRLNVENCSVVKNVYLGNWAPGAGNAVIQRGYLKVVDSDMSGSKLRGGGYNTTKINAIEIDLRNSSFVNSSIYGGGYQTTESDRISITLTGCTLTDSSVYGGGEGGLTTAKQVDITFADGTMTRSGLYAGNYMGEAVIDEITTTVSGAVLRSSSVCAGTFSNDKNSGSVAVGVRVNLNDVDDDGQITMASTTDKEASKNCDVVVTVTGNVIAGGGLAIFDGVFKSVTIDVGDGRTPTDFGTMFIITNQNIDAVNVRSGAKLRYIENDFNFLYDVNTLNLERGGVLSFSKPETVASYAGGGTLELASTARLNVTQTASGETGVEIFDGEANRTYISVNSPLEGTSFYTERDPARFLTLQQSVGADGTAWVYAALYKVDFATVEGDPIASQYLKEGETAVEPSLSIGAGYETRWYLDEARQELWDFGGVVTRDMTLYPDTILLIAVTTSGDVTTVYDGTEKTLSVQIESDAALNETTYAWYKDGGLISNDAALTLAVVADSGAYRCVVSCVGIYGEATEEVSFQVEIGKATPAVESPANLSARFGDKLNSVKLGSGWAWEDGTTDVGVPGERGFAAVYTPKDTENYLTVERTLLLTVDRAVETIEITGESGKIYDGNSIAEPTYKYRGDGAVTVEWYVQNGAAWDLLPGAPTNAGSYKVMISAAVTTLYEAASDEKTFAIGKARVDTSGLNFESVTVVSDGLIHSVLLTGDLPQGVVGTVYTNNEKSDAGIYEVWVRFLVDGVNYEQPDDMRAILTVKQKEIVNKTEETEVIVVAESGLNPDVTLNVTVIAEDIQKNYDLTEYGKNALVVKAYGVRLLDAEQNEVLPDGSVTVRLKIPDALLNKKFDLVEFAGDTATAVVYTVEGNFVVFEVESFADYVFVGQEESQIGLIVSGVAAGIIVILVTIIVVSNVIKRRKKKRAPRNSSGDQSK